MRTATIKRDTKETQIRLELNLDGTGRADIATGCGFLDHMLELFARHGDFDLTVACHGDTQVDCHHSVEDIGICLGKAFTQALGDKRGITRYGQFLLPMDETLVLSAVDLSGRDFLGWAVDLPAAKHFGITVLRVPGYSPEAVAEHAMALALAANRVHPYPGAGGGEPPPHPGGRVQGHGPDAERGGGPGSKAP